LNFPNYVDFKSELIYRTIEEHSTSPHFWNNHKPRRLMLPQTPFKTEPVVEGFWFARDSRPSNIPQHSTRWARSRLAVLQRAIIPDRHGVGVVVVRGGLEDPS